MGARTSGRQAALQMLFALDSAEQSADRAIADFWRQFPGDAEGRAYADDLLRQLFPALQSLDKMIEEVSNNWRLERMTPVDRNILRLGAFELSQRPDVPTPVIIDEAVELAKLYGTDNSSSFVNGVLDNLARKYRQSSLGNTTSIEPAEDSVPPEAEGSPLPEETTGQGKTIE